MSARSYKRHNASNNDHVTLPRSKAKHFMTLLSFLKSKLTKRQLLSIHEISSGAMEAVERGNVTVRTANAILKAYNAEKTNPSQ